MTSQPSVSSLSPRTVFRVALLGVIAQWRLIALMTVVSMVVAIAVGVAARQIAPRYTSEAVVLLTGARYQVRLDERFTTTEVLPSAQPGNPIAAITARQEEYRALAASRDVLEAAQRLVHPDIPFDEDQIQVRSRVRGTLITVEATTPNPEHAPIIAAAFATALATRLDEVYGAGETNQAQLTKELVDAEQQVEAAERRLAEFLQRSRLAERARLLDQKQLLRATLAAQQGIGAAATATYIVGGLNELARLEADARALRADLQANDGPASMGQVMAHAALQQQVYTLGSADRESLALQTQLQLLQIAIRDRDLSPPPMYVSPQSGQPTPAQIVL
ncbi:MAG: hypothetical protein NZ518_10530, partial [Dehalococcoidia bacterium]|nr:hypothetical protein [Dehalococcoidia bacterium]